ncbi:MAG: C40 family peptidase [Desulfococcaceae bacterium]
MQGRFFIRHILIIILMLQTVFVCSCSRNPKPVLRDYGTMIAENVSFSPFCDPVPYPGENQEDSKAGFSPYRTEKSSPPEAASEYKNQHKAKPDEPEEEMEDMDCEADAGAEDISETESAEKKSVPQPDMQFYRQYSRKLGIELDGTENRKLIMAVAEWIGTPYLWGGCSKDGVDCSCLIKNIYEKVYGIELRRTSIMICSEDIVPVEEHKLREGDIICFSMKKNDISHVGLYLKDNKFVHASLSGGVRISSLQRKYFKKRMLMAGRAIRPLQISIAKLSIGELVVVNR